MSGRRLLFLFLSVLLFAIAAGLLYLSLTQPPTVDKYLAVAGMLVFGPMGVVIAVRCKRWRHPEDLKAANDPASIVYLSTARFENYTVAVALFAMAVGLALTMKVFDITLQILGGIGATACVMLAVMVLARSGATWLRLSPVGLEFSEFGFGPIPWTDIRAARSIDVLGRVPVVALDLDNEAKYLARRSNRRGSGLARILMSSPFYVVSPAMDMSRDMVLRAIEVRISAFGRSGPRPATLE